MAAIHHDDLSPVAAIFQQRLTALDVVDAGRAAVRDAIVEWDGHLAPDSVGAGHYTALRWALARIVAERSTLASVASDPLTALPPGTSPTTMLWWSLPGLLRTDNTGLLGGADWDEVLLAGLDAIPLEHREWSSMHHARLQHPLAVQLPDAAEQLMHAGAALGGDNDTVWANGSVAAAGTAAVYGAVARYVYDVGNWDDCRWIVLAGTSGDPRSPHFLDQHETWARCEMVPMHYDWTTIADVATESRLAP